VEFHSAWGGGVENLVERGREKTPSGGGCHAREKPKEGRSLIPEGGKVNGIGGELDGARK